MNSDIALASVFFSTCKLATLFVALYLSWYIVRVLYRTVAYDHWSPLSNLPGPPRPSYLRGNLKEAFSEEPLVAATRWSQKYGHVMRIANFLGLERLIITDPKALNRIVVSGAYDYPKPQEIRGDLARILGKGILFAEGDIHRKQKRILSPAFNGINVAALLPVFTEKAISLRVRLIEAIDAGAGVFSGDIAPFISRCTLDVIGLAGLGTEFGSLDENKHPLTMAFAEILGERIGEGFFGQAVFFLFLSFPFLRKLLPTRKARAATAAFGTMESESNKILESAKVAALAGDKSTQKDLLSLLVKANLEGENKSRLSDDEVVGQLTTFLLAGFETTGTLLNWCLLELARNQDVQSKLREEIRQFKQNLGLDSSDTLSHEDLVALPYLDAVTKEILRVRPPVPETVRQASKDDFLHLSEPIKLKDGTETSTLVLPKDTYIIIPLQTLNLLPSIWGEDAAVFKPDRWLNPMPQSVIDSTQGFTVYSHLSSFFGGSRACIGYRFALLEFKSILSTLVETLQFEEHDEHRDIIGRSFIVNRPFVKSQTNRGSQLPLKVTMAA